MAARFAGFRFVAQFNKSRLCFKLQTPSSVLRAPLCTTAASQVTLRKIVPNEGFWDKNERMKRPMSPHLTIYKFPFPALLSGSHRATGFALSGMTLLAGAGALVLPGSLSSYIEMIQALNLPVWATAPVKMVFVWPFVYHATNGVRHLIWDTGRGFEMSNIYQTGFLIIATSLVGAAGVVAYCL